MYNHLRNDFLYAAHEAGLCNEYISNALSILDQVSSRYDIRQKELSLMAYGDELPEIVKTYLVCKKIDGLSDKTLGAYLRTLRIFFREIRKPIERIEANDVRIFLFKYQQERKCSNRSLDKYRGYLTSFFAWATDEGYLPRNPTVTLSAIKYEHKQRQALTQLELEYLRAACLTSRDRAVIEFLYSTGCRVSELCNVKKNDVNWDARTVVLFGKGSKYRTSFINAKAEVSLRAYLDTRADECEHLFVTERNPARVLKKEAVEKIVRKISDRAFDRIRKKVTPHILRHTTATAALESGMSIEEISKLLGHESINTTMIYAYSSVDSVQIAHRKHVV